MSTPTLIGGATGQDPILFVQDLLKNYIFDENGVPIRITTQYPKQINQIPRVAVILQRESMEFISIPAVRRRWTAKFDMTGYAISVEQRYAIKQSMMARIDNLSHPDIHLAGNIVYTWFEAQDYPDEVIMFGQPIYETGFTLTLKYDVLVPQAGIP